MSAALMSGPSQALRGHGAMLVFSLAVSGSFSLGSLIANAISPSALTGVRFLIAAVLLGILVGTLPNAGRGGRRGFVRADLAGFWRYVLLAVLYGGYFVLMFEGLKTASPVSTGAVFTLTPLMAALFAWPLLGQRLRTRTALALLVGASGAVWVIFRGDPAALLRFEVGRGEVIFFTGCILHALYAPMMRLLNRGESPLVTAALVTLAGFVLLAAYGWRDLRATDWTALSLLVWGVVLYLVIAATALATAMLQFAAQRLPSSRVMAYTYLTPVWIIGWELALGHGVPGLEVLPGIALITLALVLLMRADPPVTAPRQGGNRAKP